MAPGPRPPAAMDVPEPPYAPPEPPDLPELSELTLSLSQCDRALASSSDLATMDDDDMGIQEQPNLAKDSQEMEQILNDLNNTDLGQADLLQAIKTLETGDVLSTGDADSIFPLSGFDMAEPADSEGDAHTTEEKIKATQLQLERRCAFLLRRMRMLQARTLGKRVSEEVAHTIDKAMRGARKDGVGRPMGLKAFLKKVETTAALQASASSRSTSVLGPKYYRAGTSKGDASKSASIAIPSGTLAGLEDTAGALRSHVSAVKHALDSDATASSSGAESNDEAVVYNNPHQQHMPIEKRALWSYQRARASIATRWCWLQAQVQELEYKIRQHTDLHKQVREAKGPVQFEGEPAQPSAYEGLLPGATLADDDPATETCARHRPLRRDTFKKRKLLQMHNLHIATNKAAKPADVHCSCEHGLESCCVCTGRASPTQPPSEGLARLDPGYHPVLSDFKDISLGLHVGALTSARWFRARAAGTWRGAHHAPRPEPRLERTPPKPRRPTSTSIHTVVPDISLGLHVGALTSARWFRARAAGTWRGAHHAPRPEPRLERTPPKPRRPTSTSIHTVVPDISLGLHVGALTSARWFRARAAGTWRGAHHAPRPEPRLERTPPKPRRPTSTSIHTVVPDISLGLHVGALTSARWFRARAAGTWRGAHHAPRPEPRLERTPPKPRRPTSTSIHTVVPDISLGLHVGALTSARWFRARAAGTWRGAHHAPRPEPRLERTPPKPRRPTSTSIHTVVPDISLGLHVGALTSARWFRARAAGTWRGAHHAPRPEPRLERTPPKPRRPTSTSIHTVVPDISLGLHVGALTSARWFRARAAGTWRGAHHAPRPEPRLERTPPKPRRPTRLKRGRPPLSRRIKERKQSEETLTSTHERLRGRGSTEARARAASFDIDNIVIPQSVAAATRPQILTYKEIVTPKWRVMEMSDARLNNGVSKIRRLSLESEEEDISDTAVRARHLRSEARERGRYLGARRGGRGAPPAPASAPAPPPAPAPPQEPRETVRPYSPRRFPLPEHTYSDMLASMPHGYRPASPPSPPSAAGEAGEESAGDSPLSPLSPTPYEGDDPDDVEWDPSQEKVEKRKSTFR
ncbi:uncharacterized protein LOC134794162 [Cydia splendana]|uniref:uncharacterized protein LOC134794162 n=1 Tax=Cydia splendana TaxID=1100963 RepID=UPI00300C06BC